MGFGDVRPGRPASLWPELPLPNEVLPQGLMLARRLLHSCSAVARRLLGGCLAVARRLLGRCSIPFQCRVLRSLLVCAVDARTPSPNCHPASRAHVCTLPARPPTPTPRRNQASGAHAGSAVARRLLGGCVVIAWRLFGDCLVVAQSLVLVVCLLFIGHWSWLMVCC